LHFPDTEEFNNAKLFQANQMHLKNKILAQGTSVGLMTRKGTDRPGHSQRPFTLLQNQETLDHSPALRPGSDRKKETQK